jgi:hypothetical protein
VKQVKRAIKKSLAEGKIDYDKTVVFRKSEIADAVWVDKKEFLLNGNMYDVFKTDTLENDLMYYSFLDNEEGTWVKLLLAYTDYAQPINKEKDNSPLKYLMKDIISESLQFSVCSAQLVTVLFFSESIMTQQSSVNSFFTPPDSV